MTTVSLLVLPACSSSHDTVVALLPLQHVLCESGDLQSASFTDMPESVSPTQLLIRTLEDVPLVEFMYLVFICMPVES